MDDIFPNDVNISICRKILSEYNFINSILSEIERCKNKSFIGINISVTTTLLINVYDSIKKNKLIDKFSKIKCFGYIDIINENNNLCNIIRIFRNSACHSDSPNNKYKIPFSGGNVDVHSSWGFRSIDDDIVISMGKSYIYFRQDIIRAMDIITGDFREAV